MWGKISTVVDQVYELLNNTESNGKHSPMWKRKVINMIGFDRIIKCFPWIVLVDFVGKKKELLLFLPQFWYENGAKIHSNAHQAGQRWHFIPAGCGISLYENIKLFIEFIFSVANNSSAWLKEQEDITDAESNEKHNWLIVEKMWNYFRFPPWMTAFNLINRSEQNPRLIFGMKMLLIQWPPWICSLSCLLMHRYVQIPKSVRSIE